MTALQLFPASARLLRFKNRDALAEGGEGGEGDGGDDD